MCLLVTIGVDINMPYANRDDEIVCYFRVLLKRRSFAESSEGSLEKVIEKGYFLIPNSPF